MWLLLLLSVTSTSASLSTEIWSVTGTGLLEFLEKCPYVINKDQFGLVGSLFRTTLHHSEMEFVKKRIDPKIRLFV